jgi:glycogen operon protein
VDWEETGADAEFLAFAQNLIALRRRYRAFRRVNYLTGATVPKNGLKDVYWLAPEGREMANQDWAEGLRRCLGMQLGNDAPDEQRFLILLNAAPEPVEFRLAPAIAGRWAQVFDTTLADGLVRGAPAILEGGGTFALEARSLVLFQHAGES